MAQARTNRTGQRVGNLVVEASLGVGAPKRRGAKRSGRPSRLQLRCDCGRELVADAKWWKKQLRHQAELEASQGAPSLRLKLSWTCRHADCAQLVGVVGDNDLWMRYVAKRMWSDRNIATKLKKRWELTKEHWDKMSRGPCYVCGRAMDRNIGKSNGVPELCRPILVNRMRHFSADNVVSACLQCARIWRNSKYELAEVERWVSRVFNHRYGTTDFFVLGEEVKLEVGARVEELRDTLKPRREKAPSK